MFISSIVPSWRRRPAPAVLRETAGGSEPTLEGVRDALQPVLALLRERLGVQVVLVRGPAVPAGALPIVMADGRVWGSLQCVGGAADGARFVSVGLQLTARLVARLLDQQQVIGELASGTQGSLRRRLPAPRSLR